MMRITVFFAFIVFANASGLYSLDDLSPYGVGDGSLSRQEIRTPDGIIRGTLTYVDGDGTIKSISYGGENALEISKAPAAMTGEEQKEDEEKKEETDSAQTEEMKEEPAQPAENNENGKAEEANGSPAPELPQPVAYTPEVAAARAAHFAARDQAVLLQKLTANQELLNQPIVEYPPFLRDYYGAAKHLNPYYYL